MMMVVCLTFVKLGLCAVVGGVGGWGEFHSPPANISLHHATLRDASNT
jgi:hypothetical protein